MTDSKLRPALQASADALAAADPRVAAGGFLGIVLGSGLGATTEAFDDLVEVPFDDIPGFATTTVVGHSGKVCIGSVQGRTVVALRGRVHLYEGHGPTPVVHGVRSLTLAGAGAILLTNAAGGIDPTLRVGDFMAITDHINLTGQNPLMGAPGTELGPRFPDMSRVWDRGITTALLAAGLATKVRLGQGVYVGVLGPSYETPAEIRMMRAIGGDAVGMSTVLEALAAAHMGCRVAGLSIISNAAAGTGGEDHVLDHSDVSDVAGNAASNLSAVLNELLRDPTWWSA